MGVDGGPLRILIFSRSVHISQPDLQGAGRDRGQFHQHANRHRRFLTGARGRGQTPRRPQGFDSTRENSVGQISMWPGPFFSSLRPFLLPIDIYISLDYRFFDQSLVGHAHGIGPFLHPVQDIFRETN